MDNRRYAVTVVLENNQTRECVIDAAEAARLTAPQAYVGAAVPPAPEFLWFRTVDGGGLAVCIDLVETVSIRPVEGD